MTLHHTKHHQTYVTGLNAAEEQYASASTPKQRIALQAALKFNGGGHINHTLFWKNLAPAGAEGGKLPEGKLKELVERDFGSFDALKKEMNTKTAAIQGSGWGWLVSGLSAYYNAILTSCTGLQPIHEEAGDRHHCQPGPAPVYVPLAVTISGHLLMPIFQPISLSLASTFGSTPSTSSTRTSSRT
jgi:superoxide dismutase